MSARRYPWPAAQKAGGGWRGLVFQSPGRPARIITPGRGLAYATESDALAAAERAIRAGRS